MAAAAPSTKPYRGDTIKLSGLVTWVGGPATLDDCEIKSTVRNDATDEILVSYIRGANLSTTGMTVNLRIDPAVTEALVEGDVIFVDVQVKTPSATETYTVWSAKYVLRKDATR